MRGRCFWWVEVPYGLEAGTRFPNRANIGFCSIGIGQDGSLRPAPVDLDELEASVRPFAPPPIEPPRAAATVQPVVEQVTPVESAKPAEPPPSTPAGLSIVQREVQEEIRARVASFRAHQERFNREREEYFRATLARLKAAAKDSPASRLEK
jgi:hypothetical protein